MRKKPEGVVITSPGIRGLKQVLATYDGVDIRGLNLAMATYVGYGVPVATHGRVILSLATIIICADGPSTMNGGIRTAWANQK